MASEATVVVFPDSLLHTGTVSLDTLAFVVPADNRLDMAYLAGHMTA